MDVRALYLYERIETAGHTWRPIADPSKLQRAASGQLASSSEAQWASPDEYTRIRAAIAAEGADEEWLDWFMNDAGSNAGDDEVA